MANVIETEGMFLLRAFCQVHGIGPSALGRGVGVSHVTAIAYLSGAKRPEADKRDALERYTDGYVPRESWRTDEERQELEAVQPLRPSKTGTDG